MAYDRVNWINEQEGTTTPLNAENLNQMDEGIANIDERVTRIEEQGGAVNAYKTVKVGTMKIEAEGADTLTIKAGSNVNITADQEAKEITISSTGGGGSIEEPTDLEKGIIGGDEYSPTETYGNNDGLKSVCIHNNMIYSAKQASFSGIEPPNNDYWEKISIGELFKITPLNNITVDSSKVTILVNRSVIMGKIVSINITFTPKITSLTSGSTLLASGFPPPFAETTDGSGSIQFMGGAFKSGSNSPSVARFLINPSGELRFFYNGDFTFNTNNPIVVNICYITK